jgi:hypothetical protein
MRFGNPRYLHLQREMTISWPYRYLHVTVRIQNHKMWQLSARKNKGKAVGWYTLNGGRTVPVPKVQYNHCDVFCCTQTQVAPLCLSFDNVTRPFTIAVQPLRCVLLHTNPSSTSLFIVRQRDSSI